MGTTRLAVWPCWQSIEGFGNAHPCREWRWAPEQSPEADATQNTGDDLGVVLACRHFHVEAEDMLDWHNQPTGGDGETDCTGGEARDSDDLAAYAAAGN